jgi:hypothetical protein
MLSSVVRWIDRTSDKKRGEKHFYLWLSCKPLMFGGDEDGSGRKGFSQTTGHVSQLQNPTLLIWESQCMNLENAKCTCVKAAVL